MTQSARIVDAPETNRGLVRPLGGDGGSSHPSQGSSPLDKAVKCKRDKHLLAQHHSPYRHAGACQDTGKDSPISMSLALVVYRAPLWQTVHNA